MMTEQPPFDAVISTEVIEHLLYPLELLRFARPTLAKGGHLILSTPYHGYVKNVAISLAGRWDFHHHPNRDGGHVKFFSPATLKALLVAEGYHVVGWRGVGRIPYLWKSMIVVATVQ